MLARARPPRPFESDRRVAELMTRDVVTIPDAATLGDAAELLAGYGLGALAVVDEDGRLVGVLSETDLVRLRSAGNPAWTSWHRLLVREFMSLPPVVVPPDLPVAEAARVLADEHIHRLFVVDDRDLPIGVLAESDIVAEIADAT